MRAGEKPFEGPLKPGDAVGVMLVSGDLQLGGTGTVTHIDGDRVYAFGHPMYNLGPTEFPMTRAYVYTVLPSLFSSMKLSTTGEIIGTFLQDRATAIAGTLGAGPRMIPVTLALESDRAPEADVPLRRRQRSAVRTADDLRERSSTRSARTSGSSARRRSACAAPRRCEKHDAIAFDNLFAGDQAVDGRRRLRRRADHVPDGQRLREGRHRRRSTSRSRTTEEPKTATLERVWLDDPRPRAGRTVPLKVLFRTYRGDEIVRTLPIEIPANASGSLSVLVSDGDRLGLTEQREARAPQPRSVDQMIRTLNKGRRNNTLYVKLLGSDAGAVVNGELLSSLPPSVLGVLEGDRNGGNFNPLHSATLGEWELPTDHAVAGSRTLTITVSQN